MTDLKVGRRGFTIPVHMATKTMGILAVKRSGKSNAAVVMAEEMYDAGVPWVAIDPKGDWWGIKAQGTHNAPGLPVIVFGGEHGDVPLEPTSGALVADLVAEQRLTCVLDVSDFGSKADQRRFLTAFVQRLYKVNREPLHVFCEEADEYIPQRVSSGDTTLVSSFETLVKRGGFRGIGVTLITQRSASLNKDVLTQVGTLFAMRTTGPQDRKAIRDWVDWHDAGSDLVKELPRLADGEAYLFSPEDLQTVEKIHFRVRRTYDSGATPEVGKKIRPPANLADVNLDAIREAMAATIEKAEANDPKHLQKRIRELERTVQRLTDERLSAPEPEVEIREVPVIPTEMVMVMREIGEAIKRAEGIEGSVTVSVPRNSFDPVAKVTRDLPPYQAAKVLEEMAARSTSKSTSPRVGPSAPTSNSNGLPGPQVKILTALAQHGPQDKKTLAILTGYSHQGGGFNNPLGALRSAGYVAKGNPIEITESGIVTLGDYEPLPEGSALLAWWMPQLSGPEQKIVTALSEYGPLTKEALADATGYSAQGGGFNNPLGHLRTIGVITKAGTSPIDLAPEMRD